MRFSCAFGFGLLLICMVVSDRAAAVVTGQVLDGDTTLPVSGARVRVQATDTPPALTDASGNFVLDVNGAGPFVITAALSYDPARPVNYIIGSTNASDGDDVVIFLQRVPVADASPYDPSTSIDCATCHADQFLAWQGSRHAGAGVNPWVLDLFSGTGTPGGGNGYVFRDSHDPDDTGFCATCHTPLADAQDPGQVFMDEVTLAGGLDGVNCLACHQMAEVNDNTEALHHLGNTLYRFPDDPSTSLWVWGPLDDVSFNVMRASYQPGFSEAKFCASCHEYNNPDTGAPGQTTYSEWLASSWAQPGPGFRRCQDCHMPAADDPGPVSSLPGQPVRPAEQRRSHAFEGSTPAMLDQAVDLELDAALAGNVVTVQARVANSGAGHAFPTGVSIRNALLVIEARADGVPLPLASGPTIPFYGSATGSSTADDLAGRPGRGYARVLEGRINGAGPVIAPVLFIDAESVQSDTRILPGQTDVSDYQFNLGGVSAETIEVEARLLYRRAWRDLAVVKNWTLTPSGGPVQVEVERALVALSGPGQTHAIPTLTPVGLITLVLSLLAAAAVATRIRGRRPRRSRR
ncbi:MAG: hypothetical protein Kow0020_09510 [Wenzhouxiangellaceae bacterium]